MHAATTTNRNDAPFPIQESALLSRDELKKLLPDPHGLPILGATECSLDRKNRLHIPATLRDRYVDGLMILRSNHGTFFLLDSVQSGQFVAKLNEQASVDPTLQDRLPHIYSAALVVKALDSAKRLSIPTEFADRWQLNSRGKVMICGIGSCLEIFTVQSWDNLLRQGTLWGGELQVPSPDLF